MNLCKATVIQFMVMLICYQFENRFKICFSINACLVWLLRHYHKAAEETTLLPTAKIRFSENFNTTSKMIKLKSLTENVVEIWNEQLFLKYRQ
jgi:hypothetical protein